MFFIAGMQKAGTTALHEYLSHHSQLSLSVPKELHIFDDETIDWEAPNDSIESRLQPVTGRIYGEATPIYIYWPNSLERMHTYNSSAKIIILLRHPAFRAYSHWSMETNRKNELLPFSDAIRSGRSRVRNAKNGVHRVFSYVERGFYATQISKVLKYFPRDQIHLATTDQLWLSPKLTMSSIERFLGVREELSPKRGYIISAKTNQPVTLSPEDYTFLLDTYRDDIISTIAMTGLPLKMWLSSDYHEAEKASD